MILALKQPNGSFPPGGWPFTDPRTKKTWNGYEGTPQMHAISIIAHRRMNPKVYSPDEPQWFDMLLVIQEIYAQKFATQPAIFRGQADATLGVVQKPVSGDQKCSKCGATDFEPVYCKTCGGQKVKGWKCRSCGTEL